MKRNIYILFTIGLFIRILPSHSVNLNTERLSNLKRLIENNIAYDSIAPIDSVIAWGQQLSPILEKENKMELSFSIRQLVVYIYSLRGDIGKAIDEARQMYEKAETMRYDLGIALSSAAIGDAYFCSNMPEEATDSYKEAIRYPASPSENNHYKEMTILKLIQVLILTQRTEEAEKYRKILSESKSIQNPSDAAISDTCYRCFLLYPEERSAQCEQLPAASRANLPFGQATLLSHHLQLYARTI